MRYPLFLSISYVALFVACGCNDNSQLEARIDELKRTVESRLDAQDEKIEKLKIDSILAELKEHRTGWSSFQEAYSPETREELRRNLDEVSKKSQSIEETRLLAQKVIQKINQMESQAKQLRDITKKHFEESKKYDKIGKLGALVKAMQKELKELKSDVDVASWRASQADRRARRAERKAR